MIKFKDSQVTQILPVYFTGKPEVRALSYAINKAVQRLIDYCENISVYAVIDTAPAYVLDRLALELGTQYYDDTMDIAAKRRLIKNTLVWYISAGTPKAVGELVAMSFGSGDVQEWFEYGGDPYMFRVITSADADPESIAEFEKIIEKVKNIRSHIDEVMFIRTQELDIYVAVANLGKTVVRIGWE